jgi:hypothetical protein
MFTWFKNKTIEKQLDDARAALTSFRLKLHKEGADSTRTYGIGVGETAGLLAQRFQIPLAQAIEAQGLEWRQLDDTARDLMKSVQTMRPKLKSEMQSVRNVAHKMTFSGLLFHHLYRVRFLATQAAEPQKSRAIEVAEAYARFARVMTEIGADIRDPSAAYT